MKHIGYIGLGKMGENMVERLLEKGWHVSATDPNVEARTRAENAGATVHATINDLVNEIASPRLIWIMVPHTAVDAVLEELLPMLSAGDTVIDGGNSNYKETIRRAKELREIGVQFLDAGVSGGPSGARDGAAVMVGGERSVFEKYESLFQDLSKERSYGYMGKSGAGHFVKMVHNGIEYGMMQAIAEGFTIMRQAPLSLDLKEVAHVYRRGTVIESRLVDWISQAFTEHSPDLTGISGEISHSGEGQWTVEVARELNIPVPVIEKSLQFRMESKGNPSYTGKVVSALRNQFGGHTVTE